MQRTRINLTLALLSLGLAVPVLAQTTAEPSTSPSPSAIRIPRQLTPPPSPMPRPFPGGPRDDELTLDESRQRIQKLDRLISEAMGHAMAWSRRLLVLTEEAADLPRGLRRANLREQEEIRDHIQAWNARVRRLRDRRRGLVNRYRRGEIPEPAEDTAQARQGLEDLKELAATIERIKNTFRTNKQRIKKNRAALRELKGKDPAVQERRQELRERLEQQLTYRKNLKRVLEAYRARYGELFDQFGDAFVLDEFREHQAGDRPPGTGSSVFGGRRTDDTK